MTEDSEDDADPFEKLDDAVGDRQGDPFENLSSDEAAETDEAEPTPAPESSQGNPGEAKSGPTNESSESESEPKTNFSERGSEPVQNFSESKSDPAQDPFDRFSDDSETSRNTETAQTEEQSASEQSEESGMEFGIGRRESEEPDDMPPLSDLSGREGDPFEGFDDAFETEDVEQVDPDLVWQELTSAESRGSVGDAKKRTYAEVSKHSYCEQCEHFSEPPDVHCTHEGTEIVEFLDMETVRLVDCPIVTKRKKLEDDGHGKD